MINPSIWIMAVSLLQCYGYLFNRTYSTPYNVFVAFQGRTMSTWAFKAIYGVYGGIYLRMADQYMEYKEYSPLTAYKASGALAPPRRPAQEKLNAFDGEKLRIAASENQLAWTRNSRCSSYGCLVEQLQTNQLAADSLAWLGGFLFRSGLTSRRVEAEFSPVAATATSY